MWRTVATVALSLALGACGGSSGSDDGEPPETFEGPLITFFGLARADDQLIEPVGNLNGIPVFRRPETSSGGASGFSIVVEAKPGRSGSFVGTSSFVPDLSDLPDLQIQVNRPLGNGGAAVCEDPRTNPGGVPAIPRPSFAETPANFAILNDFGCRFLDGAGNPIARQSGADSCVAFPSGDFGFVRTDSTVQFCGFINVPLAFPRGDTTISARVRDEAGNLGPMAQLIVRVP